MEALRKSVPKKLSRARPLSARLAAIPADRADSYSWVNFERIENQKPRLPQYSWFIPESLSWKVRYFEIRLLEKEVAHPYLLKDTRDLCRPGTQGL